MLYLLVLPISSAISCQCLAATSLWLQCLWRLSHRFGRSWTALIIASLSVAIFYTELEPEKKITYNFTVKTLFQNIPSSQYKLLKLDATLAELKRICSRSRLLLDSLNTSLAQALNHMYPLNIKMRKTNCKPKYVMCILHTFGNHLTFIRFNI